MATYRFPAASPSTSAVEMLLKGIALRQAMNREERGEAQDTREAALNALRMRQAQQGIEQNAVAMEEARRAMGEEAAVREAMPALRAAPPTSIATVPGRPAVQAQFAPPEGPVETGVPLPNMEPGTSIFETAPAQPAVEPRSVGAFTEAGLMEAAGGPAGYERLTRTRTGQAFLTERKPLSKPDVDKLVRADKARSAYLAALDKARHQMNTFDPTGMNHVRAYDAIIESQRALAEVDANPENVTKNITSLMEKRSKLFNKEEARLLIAEDNRKILPAYEAWVTKNDAESLAGYIRALLGAKSPEVILRGINFVTGASGKQLETFRAKEETKRFAPYLDAVMAEIGASLTGGKSPDPNLWSEAGLKVFAKAQQDAASPHPVVSGPAKTILAAAAETLSQAIHGTGKGAENLGKLFLRTDAKEQLPVYREAVQRVKATVTSDEKDPRYWPAVMRTVKEMTAAGVRPSAAPREQFWQSPHKRLQELAMLDRAADREIKTARDAIKALNEGVVVRSQRESPEHLAKLRPFEEAIANAEAQKSANREEMAGLGPGIAPPEPKPSTTAPTANPPPVGVDQQTLRSAMKTESARLLALPGATPESVKAAMRRAGWQ